MWWLVVYGVCHCPLLLPGDATISNDSRLSFRFCIY